MQDGEEAGSLPEFAQSIKADEGVHEFPQKQARSGGRAESRRNRDCSQEQHGLQYRKEAPPDFLESMREGSPQWRRPHFRKLSSVDLLESTSEKQDTWKILQNELLEIPDGQLGKGLDTSATTKAKRCNSKLATVGKRDRAAKR